MLHTHRYIHSYVVRAHKCMASFICTFMHFLFAVAKSGVVLATEKKLPSPLVEPDSAAKISLVAPGLGLVYSGMGPDARVLVGKARKAAQSYWMERHQWPCALHLVKELASVMQEFTQSGGVRPFGVSLLVAGFDIDDKCESAASLYQVDPSGSYWQWKASAIGKNMVSAKSFLEKRYQEELSTEDAIHTAILTLKEGYEGVMTCDSLEIGVLSMVPLQSSSFGHLPEWKTETSVPEFRTLSESEVKEYLDNL